MVEVCIIIITGSNSMIHVIRIEIQSLLILDIYFYMIYFVMSLVLYSISQLYKTEPS